MPPAVPLVAPLVMLLGAALWLADGVGRPGAGTAAASPLERCDGPPDLQGFTTVLDDPFQSLGLADEGTGPWTTRPGRGNLVTNGPLSVFLSQDVLAEDGTPVGLHPFRVEDGVLSIEAGVIPQDRLGLVESALARVGQAQFVGRTRYYTGLITTITSLAQTYGWFEIRARIPRGRGHWPAFWLAPATPGWPPEIDVMEAYGKTVSGNPHDDRFIVAVYFDAIAPDGEARFDVDITNPFAPEAGRSDGGPEAPDVLERMGRTQYRFERKFDAADAFDADIYGDFHTYAAAWTPQHITFYFGRDHDTLQPIYRTPTPDDLHSNMVVIANGQVSTRWGWNPVEAHLEETFAPDNVFAVDHVRIDMLTPQRLTATAGDDLVRPASGQALLALSGGADTVLVARAQGNLLVEGFGADDVLALEGFPFANPEEALAKAITVGDDTWFTAANRELGAQTVILRGVAAATLSAVNIATRWPVTEPLWARRDRDGTVKRDETGTGKVVAGEAASRLTDGGVRGRITLEGSPQGDLYIIRKSDTVILETAEGGVDTVTTATDFALSPHVENAVAERPGLTLTGNALGNRLTGSDGPDTLNGGPGADLLTLGAGADTVIMGRAATAADGDNHDTLFDFGADDRLVLEGVGGTPEALLARLEGHGRDSALSLGPGASVVFKDLAPDALGPDNFVLDPAAPPPDAVAPIPFSRAGGPTALAVAEMATAYGGPCAPGPIDER